MFLGLFLLFKYLCKWGFMCCEGQNQAKLEASVTSDRVSIPEGHLHIPGCSRNWRPVPWPDSMGWEEAGVLAPTMRHLSF